MARAKGKSAPGKSERKTLVRGADGGLYLLTDKNLAPFKLEEDKAESVTQILKDACEEPVTEKLSTKVVKEIRGEGHGVNVSAETYINIVRKD
jgi:hypothetical protein